MARVVKVNCVLIATLTLLLMTHHLGCSEAKRSWGSSNRKTSSGGGSSRTPSPGNSGHVTKPSYPTQSGSGSSNSNSDLAKLSYSGYNAAPNRPGTSAGGAQPNSQPIGWNVPKQQGPPPAYSASNPVGGAHTNLNEAPPAYRPNNAAPPSYGASNVHTPITATNTQGVQSSYPGATYHSPGAVPPGATYYQSAGQVPAGATYHAPGAMPAGATYYPSAGQMPGGGGYYPAGATHYPAGGVPAGATYLPAGAAMPAGATYYSQPPQQSSGLGFGSGLAAGAIGGALLGHVLTPTETRVVQAAPAAGADGGSGDSKVIIINNGPPGSVTTSGDATVINTGASVMNGTQPAAPAAPAAATAAAAASDPAIPNVPLAPMGETNHTINTTDTPAAAGAPVPAPVPAAGPEQPPPGGIICVPVRINETDPADSSKMVEVEKIACYPAPPPPPPATTENNGTTATVMPPVDGATGAPLAPLNAVPNSSTHQLQQNPAQTAALPENAQVRAAGNGAKVPLLSSFSVLFATLLPLLCAFFGSG